VRAFVSGLDTRKDVAAELFYLEAEQVPLALDGDGDGDGAGPH
jgi:hypothetical protein